MPREISNDLVVLWELIFPLHHYNRFNRGRKHGTTKRISVFNSLIPRDTFIPQSLLSTLVQVLFCSQFLPQTELLPTHGPIPSRCCGLLWLNVLFTGNWGWRHREPFYLPYHEPALVIEWQRHTCSFLLDTKPLWHWGKWKNGPTGKRDPRPRDRPTGKCPLYRVEATGQLLHSAVGSNQVGCSCTWPRSVPREINSGTTKEIPALNQGWRGCDHLTSNWAYKGHQVPYHVFRGPPAACHHCGQTLSIDHMFLEYAVLQECREEYYTADSLNTLFEIIPETCIVEFLWDSSICYELSDILYKSSLESPPDLMEIVNFN